jgi:cytidyltransferase-like protein
MKRIIVSSGFDQAGSAGFRLLQEAAKLGEVHVVLWSDEAMRTVFNRVPVFPGAEREYVIRAVRYVTEVHVSRAEIDPDALPDPPSLKPDVWVVEEKNDTPAKRAFCAARGLGYRVLTRRDLAGFPLPPLPPVPGKKRVVVTGCYDFFHSGHVRFFEEAAALGDLFVVVGHDENIRLLKGAGHPLFTEAERRYLVGSIRYVRQALISTGTGWLDAEQEIATIKPDFYVVNEDGDKPEKREFCRENGIQYVVLRRQPAPGLSRRTSTDLRGF